MRVRVPQGHEEASHSIGGSVPPPLVERGK
nr:MAG TPA: hypothetical protein [Caudoviricetes sp.]